MLLDSTVHGADAACEAGAMNVLSFLIIMLGLLVGGVLFLFSLVSGIATGFSAFWWAGLLIGLLIFVVAVLVGIGAEKVLEAIG